MQKGRIRYHVEWDKTNIFFITKVVINKKKKFDSNVIVLEVIYDSSKKRDLKSHYPANVLNDKLLSPKEVLKVVFTRNG